MEQVKIWVIKIFEGRFECPRCGKIITVQQGSPDFECDCHLYCSDGERPQDCSVTEVNHTGDLGWPFGRHGEDLQEGDDVLHRVRYCSTHDKYIYKTQVIVPIDWKEYYSRRLPRHLRTG